MTTQITQPLKIFCSYIQEEENYYNEVRAQSAHLLREGNASMIGEHENPAGVQRKQWIEQQINKANMIIILLSSSYISDDIHYNWLKDFYNRSQAGISVVPIIIKPCPWEQTPLAKLTVFPRSHKALSLLTKPKRGEVLKQIIKDTTAAYSSSLPSELSSVSKNPLSQTDSTIHNTANMMLQEKIARKEFDVFLCHNAQDKPEIRRIGHLLREHGIRPWLDEWELRPGLPWQRVLEEQIAQVKSAAVFVGKNGFGPWQQQEKDAFLREFVRRKCPVIPVLLKDAPQEPPLPLFLQGLTWVDFRQSDPDPLKQLIWGITDQRQ